MTRHTKQTYKQRDKWMGQITNKNNKQRQQINTKTQKINKNQNT